MDRVATISRGNSLNSTIEEVRAAYAEDYITRSQIRCAVVGSAFAPQELACPDII